MTEHSHANILVALNDPAPNAATDALPPADAETAPYPAGVPATRSISFTITMPDIVPPPAAGTRPAAMLSYRENAAPAEEQAPPYLIAGNCTYVPTLYDAFGRVVNASRLGGVHTAKAPPDEPVMTTAEVVYRSRTTREPASNGAWALLGLLLMAWAAWTVIR